MSYITYVHKSDLHISLTVFPLTLRWFPTTTVCLPSERSCHVSAVNAVPPQPWHSNDKSSCWEVVMRWGAGSWVEFSWVNTTRWNPSLGSKFEGDKWFFSRLFFGVARHDLHSQIGFSLDFLLMILIWSAKILSCVTHQESSFRMCHPR